PGVEPPPCEAQAIRGRVLDGGSDSQAPVLEEGHAEILAASPVVQRVSLSSLWYPHLDRERRCLDDARCSAVVLTLQSRGVPTEVLAHARKQGRGSLAASASDAIWVVRRGGG